MSMLMAEATGRARLGQMAGRWAMITARWERSRSGEGKRRKKGRRRGSRRGTRLAGCVGGQVAGGV